MLTKQPSGSLKAGTLISGDIYSDLEVMVARERLLGVSAWYDIFRYLKGPFIKYDHGHLMRISMDKIEEYLSLKTSIAAFIRCTQGRLRRF